MHNNQEHLTAFEGSSINNFMLIKNALLGLVAFNRSFGTHQIVAILVVFGSIVSIQQ